MRKIGTVGFVVGGAFGVALVATCGGGGGGGRLADGGILDAAIRDAADLVDVQDAEAGPGPAVEAACDQVRTRTMTLPGTATVTTTTWYADIALSGFEPTEAPQFSVFGCDTECFGSSCDPEACPAGWTCKTSGFDPPSLDCHAYSNAASAGTGRVLVPCGSRSQTNYVSDTLTDTDVGTRYRTVYVRFD